MNYTPTNQENLVLVTAAERVRKEFQSRITPTVTRLQHKRLKFTARLRSITETHYRVIVESCAGPSFHHDWLIEDCEILD